MQSKVSQLFAQTTGHRFAGIITARVDDDAGQTRYETVWRCDHAHIELGDAQACAEKRLKKLIEKS